MGRPGAITCVAVAQFEERVGKRVRSEKRIPKMASVYTSMAVGRLASSQR